MAAQVIPMFGNEPFCDGQQDWKAWCLSFVSEILDGLLKGFRMDKLSDITSTLFTHKADVLGQMALALIRKRHGALLERKECQCPKCGKVLTRRGNHKRRVETMAVGFELERPYFYCTKCSLGVYPLDEALGLSARARQEDVQNVGIWLATELPYELASETFKRCTGMEISAHCSHE